MAGRSPHLPLAISGETTVRPRDPSFANLMGQGSTPKAGV